VSRIVHDMKMKYFYRYVFDVAGIHEDAYQKGKRGSAGLIPMPRVGRSDLTWSLTGWY
jgi:hypothetical protein